MDALATVLDPLYTQEHVTVDVLTGHPIRAVEDAWDGEVETVKDGWHTVEDVGEAVWPF